MELHKNSNSKLLHVYASQRCIYIHVCAFVAVNHIVSIYGRYESWLTHTHTHTRRIEINNTIKVSDFGLSEDIYAKNYFRQDKTAGVKLPVKWMAPESLNDGLFSEKSDVVSLCSQQVMACLLFKLHSHSLCRKCIAMHGIEYSLHLWNWIFCIYLELFPRYGVAHV